MVRRLRRLAETVRSTVVLQTGQGPELLPVHPVRAPHMPAVLAGGGLVHPHAVLQVPGVVPGGQPRAQVQQGVRSDIF